MPFAPHMALLALSALVGSPSGPIVEASGPGTCPSAATVERELAGLLRDRGAGAREAAARHRVRLAESNGNVHVELVAADGDVLVARALPAARSCADLSVAVAVIIATWEAEFDAGDGARFSVGPETAPPAPPVPRGPASVTSTASRTPPQRPVTFAVGLGFLTSLVNGAVAPGARLEGRLAPSERRLGLALSLSAATARSASVGSQVDVARWTRATLAAGPEVRLGDGARTLDFHLLALAAALKVSGSGLPTTHSATTGQLGIGTGTRAGWSWGPGMAWLGADALLFPGRDALVVDGLATTGTLPHFEFQVVAGVSFGRFR